MRFFEGSRKPRRPALRLALFALVGAVGVLGVSAALAFAELRQVADDLRRAESMLTQGAQLVEDGEVRAGRERLEQAQGILTNANGSLYNHVALDAIGWVPPIAQNLDALRESTGLALTLVDGGTSVLRTAEPLVADDGRLEVPLSAGALPVDTISELGVEMQNVAAGLRNPDRPDGRFLLGDVKELVAKIHEQADLRIGHFETLGQALDVLSDFSGADFPKTYFIAVANTAEMRGTGGMVLSYGVLHSEGGDFRLSEFGRIDELSFAGPVSVNPEVVPADYVARWEGFGPLSRWRNATMSPNFTLTAPVLAQMYEASTGTPVDGVIHIDPQGLAAILEGVGPVDVAELGTVTADNVVDLVLNQAYIRFPDIEERSDVLGDVAEAVFGRLVTGDYGSLRPLADAVVESSFGRHIMLWSTSGRTESKIAGFGLDGSLPEPDENAYALTVQNASGNKLDYYVDTGLALESGDDGVLRATVDIENTVPTDLTEPAYIVGPFVESDQPVGNYRAVVSLYVPFGTRLAGTNAPGVIDQPALQAEDGHSVIAWLVDVPAGESRTAQLELELPAALDASRGVAFVPTPRVRPTTVRVDADFGAGMITQSGELDGPLHWEP